MWSVIFTLPMLIPSISHGMGLTLLFGDNGFFTNLTGINIHLYGLTGIVIGATLYSCPMAFLMLTDIFQYEDFTVYEIADVLGLSKKQQLQAITLSNLKKPLISAFFAVFTVVFTDYGVPLIVGGKMMTLPVYMYREVIGLLDYSKGGIIGVILLVPAVIAFIIDFLNKDTGANSTVTKPYVIKKNRKRDIFARIYESGDWRVSAEFPVYRADNGFSRYISYILCGVRYRPFREEFFFHGNPFDFPGFLIVSGYCFGLVLCAVFPRKLYLWDNCHIDHCEYHLLFCVTLFAGL